MIDPLARTKSPCPSCEASDRYAPARYCVSARCYCGHDDCPAFDSWIDLTTIPISDTAVTTGRAATWAEREGGSSWIDKL